MIRCCPLLIADPNRHHYRLGLVICVLTMMIGLAGCTQSDKIDDVSTAPPVTSNSPEKKGNYITASPNPVPAGTEAHGKTIVAWKTKDIPAQEVHVYVSEKGGQENLFATGSEGSQEAPWIPTGSPIEFKLYSGSGAQRKLLDQVVVTRNP